MDLNDFNDCIFIVYQYVVANKKSDKRRVKLFIE